MKKLLATLTASLLWCGLAVSAQPPSPVKGLVKDESGKPVAAASVSLFRAKDTSLIKAAFTDQAGLFQFDAIERGSYLVGVSVVGYQKQLLPVEPGNAAVSFLLLPEAKGLKEVTVTARKPLFEQKADKMVVNVDAAPSNAGATALEVLEKSPGITVDKDGNISLKGKAGVQVFIDGKPTYLSGQDLVNYLRNLQGGQLDQIEIMTNPPAKYDAAGNSGIINIKTKRTRQMGYNITLNGGYTQGVYSRNNQGITFNYRKNKLNLFGNLNRNERNHFQSLSIERKFMEPDTKVVLSHFDQVSSMQNWNASNNAKLGFDYAINKKSTIGAVVNGFYNPGVFNNRSDINIANAANVLQSKAYAISRSENEWSNISTNINFRHVFDSTGRELTADVDYLNYNAVQSQNLSNFYADANGGATIAPDFLVGDLPQLINIYTAKVDYVHPLKKKVPGWKPV